MGDLFVMMGVPGSGKTTLAKKLVEDKPNTVRVSRDDIRFFLLEKGDEYFAKEDKVFKTFTETIDKYLAEGKNVIADATHLNWGSRKKLINNLTVKPDQILIVYVKVPLEKALKQNELRKGTKSYVPPEVIKNMWESLKPPAVYENDFYYEADENGEITLINLY
jgi:predicted kinase